MSFLDKIAAAVTPTASDEDRAEARRKARGLAGTTGWLAAILDHHEGIEAAFARAKAAPDAQQRLAAMKELGILLTGHSIAEEVALYPAVEELSGKTHAGMAYEEQQMAKLQMNKLERIDPMSDDWREKLEHIEGAVQQHVYQEEDSWFPDVARDAPPELQDMITRRYNEEYRRYRG